MQWPTLEKRSFRVHTRFLRSMRLCERRRSRLKEGILERPPLFEAELLGPGHEASIAAAPLKLLLQMSIVRADHAPAQPWGTAWTPGDWGRVSAMVLIFRRRQPSATRGTGKS